MKNIHVAIILFKGEKGEMLLNHRKDPLTPDQDVWEFIGGGVEENEDPADTIKREIYEELGYKIDPVKDNLIFVRTFTHTGSKFIAKVNFFTASFPGFENFSSSNEVNVSDLKLFSLAQALTLPLLPITREILTTLS